MYLNWRDSPLRHQQQRLPSVRKAGSVCLRSQGGDAVRLFPFRVFQRLLGLHTAIKPLLSHSTTK
eukprot:1480268-Pyramimonas_sp.AAC.2